MSIYDHYDSTTNPTNDSGGIGGSAKYGTVAANAAAVAAAASSSSSSSTNKPHNSIDSFYNTELSLKHQLCDIALSMASLCNIGNSCYMNSVIYTLRFTPLFLHNLHHLVSDFSQIVSRKDTQMKLKSASLGRNVSSLQCQNSRSYSSKDLVSLGSSSPSPSSTSSSSATAAATATSTTLPAYDIIKTTQQRAVEKLHDLFKSLTSNEIADSIEPYQSDILLKAIQDVNPIFEGNQQQDAHEFLMCILDSIRESCQSLTKVINDYPEIVVGGLAAENPIERITKPPVNIPPANERKPAWFKRRKEDKNRAIITDSPSRDVNSIDSSGVVVNTTALTSTSTTAAATTAASSSSSSSVAVAATGADAASDKNACGGSFVETLLISKQTIQEKIKALGLDFFSEDFEGVTASSIQCLACETTTEQKETMIDLAVPITENMETHELSDSFIQNLCITRERFQSDNKFRCENCMGLTEAIRKISYPKLPRILIIQLKRFSGGMEKINSYIPTPFTLQCFCSECISDYGNAKEHEYKLYSVITHVGSTLQAGHYIAYTCSLNQDSIYIDCQKNRCRKDVQLALASPSASSASDSSINRQNSFTTSNSSANSSTVSNVMKKISGLSWKKSSSNHVDMGKNVKTLNGVRSMVNGSDHSLNSDCATSQKTLCSGHSCCGIKMKTPSSSSMNAAAAGAGAGAAASSSLSSNPCGNGNHSDSTLLSNGNGIGIGSDTNLTDSTHSRKLNVINLYSDQYYGNTSNNIGGDSSSNSANSTNSSSNYVGPHKLRNEPIWYMCDDDKIKAIPQQEFREMLLPKKNMITPYLLFYARNDVLGSH